MSVYALLDPAVRLANDLLLRIADLLPVLTGGPALAVAVAMLTVLVRVLLLPLAVRAELANRARAALAPQLAALRGRYADDRRRLAQETMRLHRAAGVRPFAGIGTGLLQLPVLTTLYRAVAAPSIAGTPNALAGAAVLGAPLAAHWPAVLTTAGALSAPAGLFAVLVLALAVTAHLSGRQQAARVGMDAPAGSTPERLARLMPYGTVAFAAVAPVAVSVYLLSTTTWTVVERALLTRFL